MIGLFDLIMSDCYTLTDGGSIQFYISDDQQRTQEIFRSLFFAENPKLETEILAINVLLFLSMLPLHRDRPMAQQAMIANAIRLFGDLTALDQ